MIYFLKTSFVLITAMLVFFMSATGLLMPIGQNNIEQAHAMSGKGNNKDRRFIADNPRLLIMAGTPDKISEQLNFFETAIADMVDRDILVLRKSNKSDVFTIVPSLTHPDFLADDVARYARYNAAIEDKDFTLLLVGKDGGVKETWHAPILFDDVATLIDQMPMRRREQAE